MGRSIEEDQGPIRDAVDWDCSVSLDTYVEDSIRDYLTISVCRGNNRSGLILKHRKEDQSNEFDRID